MKPRTVTPQARLQAVETLARSSIPVGVMMGPIIPGLTDHEIPKLLTAAKNAGAQTFAHTLLRLPLNVHPIFLDWLERHQPLRAKHIEGRIRDVRNGQWNSSLDIMNFRRPVISEMSQRPLFGEDHSDLLN